MVFTPGREDHWHDGSKNLKTYCKNKMCIWEHFHMKLGLNNCEKYFLLNCYFQAQFEFFESKSTFSNKYKHNYPHRSMFVCIFLRNPPGVASSSNYFPNIVVDVKLLHFVVNLATDTRLRETPQTTFH